MKAFPNGMITDDRGVIVSSQPGMDLRDYFAAKAMQALIPVTLKSIANETITPNKILVSAYEWADLMIKARNGSL